MEKTEATERVFLTTPIYYVNSEPHIGGIYTTLMTDIACRFNRLNGRETWFLTGTDEHGQKIQQSAEAASLGERQFVDMMAKKFEDINRYMKFDHSDFLRTTERRHKLFVQDVWRRLMENGWLYRGKYSGWYCVSDEAYYSRDDLLESPGGELRTTLGKTVEWKEEDSYFFKLSKFQRILLELYGHTDFIRPSFRRNEVVAFVSGKSLRELERESFSEGYLRDLSISRNNFSWGIEIPCDDSGKQLIDADGWLASVAEKDRHVIYVWLDALFNYQSAPQSFGILDKFWRGGRVVHFVGKDILRFHTVYWPALLIALDYRVDELEKVKLEDLLARNILPTTVFAHGWWTRDGRKISKSLGNALSAKEEIKFLVKEFAIGEDTAIDYLKYYLATEMPFGSDGDYSRERLLEKINAELANNIGNLVHRVLMMIDKNLDGEIGEVEVPPEEKFRELLSGGTINEFDYISYRDLILAISSEANGYLERMAPWNLKKEGKVREMAAVLEKGLQDIVRISILLQVLCPQLAERILDHLAVGQRNFDVLYGGGCSVPKQKLARPGVFFPRLEKRPEI
ncbi:MAG: methionine--tRNA ligase [Rickettsiales bacterium]|jgi:methionyl-tRNA synthetase|nr:methionine--tRNA ligase [Rickettsiales bacterium]